MKKTITALFIGLFILAGCGQSGPLVLPEKKSSAKQESIDEKKVQPNTKPKKSS